MRIINSRLPLFIYLRLSLLYRPSFAVRFKNHVFGAPVASSVKVAGWLFRSARSSVQDVIIAVAWLLWTTVRCRRATSRIQLGTTVNIANRAGARVVTAG